MHLLQTSILLSCFVLYATGHDDASHQLIADHFANFIDDALDVAWATFKHDFEKHYESPADELHRRMVWEDNLRLIEKHNAETAQGKHTYRLGLNDFADLTHAEFLTRFGIHSGAVKVSNNNENQQIDSNLFDGVSKLPTSVDWRKKNCVTEVVDQGQCGSSWAFAATGAMEGQHAKKTKNLVSLSVQNLLDCTGPQGNQGCNGGLMNQSFQYVISNQGIDTTAAYPYEAQDGQCRFQRNKVGATISSYKNLPAGNETAMQAAVAMVGPVSIAIDASQSSFQLYKDGVYSDPNCDNQNPNHGALIIGYGVSSKQGDYWIVKNTWGKTWGLDGYIWTARNDNNMCGVATFSSYPLA